MNRNGQTQQVPGGEPVGFEPIVRGAAAMVVTVLGRRNRPVSGWLWQDGLVISAAHGIAREDGLRVRVDGGAALAASVKAIDPATDLALLAIDGPGTSAAAPEISHSIAVGQSVVTVGRDSDGQLCAQSAMIGLVGGAWRSWGGARFERRVRLDRTLYPGFSGGPTFDATGALIGIATAGLSRITGIVIAAGELVRCAEQLRSAGRVARSYLGIAAQSVRLPASISAQLTPPAEHGLIVMGCATEGPAERAGVLIGDVLVGVDGQPTANIDQLQAVLDAIEVGRTVSATVVRGGQTQSLSIALGERQHGRARH